MVFDMGLDLTWRHEDRVRFGNCGEDLEAIVHFRLPESSGAANGSFTASPERDSHYTINHPDVLHGLELPEGETGYALEYTQMTRILDREETETRLRKGLEEQYPKDFPEREKVIEDLVQSYFTPYSFHSIGTSFVAGMIMKDGEAEVSVKKFVRWVPKEGYEQKAEEAKRRTETGDEEVWISDRWYSQLSHEQKQEKCSTCHLNTSLSNEGKNAGCYRGTSYSHVGTFIDYISRYGNFPLLQEQMNSDGEFKVEDLVQLEGEVSRAREILESTKTPAINLYDNDGKIIETVPHDTGSLYGNEMYGYGVGLEGKEDAITVVFQGESIFSLPVEVRRQIIDSEGLEGIMAASHEIHENQPRFHFTEIYREGDTFFGKTKSGQAVELPPIEAREGNKFTPFDGYGERTVRMEYTEVPATESFGYITDLLQKHLDIANRFNIPIKGA